MEEGAGTEEAGEEDRLGNTVVDKKPVSELTQATRDLVGVLRQGDKFERWVFRILAIILAASVLIGLAFRAWR